MNKFNASKETGLPPNTSTRAEVPDARLNNAKSVTQDSRLKFLKRKPGRKFDKVGQIGPV